MLAGVYNIHCDQGSTFFRVLTVTQPSVSGDIPVDLNGYTARMTIRRKIGGDVLISLTTANGGLAIDTEASTVTISMTATQTASLARSGVYDLELVAGSTVNKLLRGDFVLRREVTT